ncbi:MAG: hypothetical protein ACLUE2_06865 [Bacteroides cellulosilyticus]
MKRILFILLATLSTAVCSAGTNAMSNSKVRKETRFLTDKMAYELNLSTEQYNDVYEINYDFISGVRYVMDDVLYMVMRWALNRYYDYLDVRNDDLRWVLSSRQYARFMQAEYFYRPIYTSGNRWYFRVYITYTNHNHFYFPRPYHYRTYVGGHYRTHHNNVSYYRGRYKHPYYNGSYRIRDTKSYTTHRRSDFGSVTVRPALTVRRREMMCTLPVAVVQVAIALPLQALPAGKVRTAVQLLIPAAVHVVPTVVRRVVLLTLIIARVPIIVVHVIVAALVLTVAVRVPIAVVKRRAMQALPAVAAVLHRVPDVRKAVLLVYGVLPEAVHAAAVLLQQEAAAPVVPAVLQVIVAKQKTSELFVYLPNNSFLSHTAFAQSLSGPTREAWYVAL